MSKKTMLVPVLVLLLFFSACQKNNFTVDLNETITAPTAPQFVPINKVLRVDYFVSDGGPVLKIPVGLTNVANQDREIKLVYSSRKAQSGIQYIAPGSITIKAGKAVDTLSFQGIFAGYPAGRKDTVMIKFADMKGVERKDSFQVVLQRYCKVVINDLIGIYANTNEYSSAGAFSYGPYTTAVTNIVSTGATTAEGYMSNLYDYGWDDIKFVMDWSDPNPANFKITIPLQATNGGGAAYVRSTAGKTNTFSSCDQTFSISIDLLNASQTVVSSGYQIRLAR